MKIGIKNYPNLRGIYLYNNDMYIKNINHYFQYIILQVTKKDCFSLIVDGQEESDLNE